MTVRTMSFAAVLCFAAGSVSAASWTIDPAASHLAFSGQQTGEAFRGEFKKFSGSIDFDPAQPAAAHVAITVDMASAVTGDTQRDEAMPQVDWFDTAQFATATFVATGFQKTATGYSSPGKLTVRGATLDVTLPFTLAIDGANAHAKGHVQLTRTAFGVGQGPWATEQWVAFAVGVDVDLVAHAK